MATQYTAGITQGQAWTAAIANQIGAAAESYTPTVTGLPTSSLVGRYIQVNNHVTVFVSMTASGAATANIAVTLPTSTNSSTRTLWQGASGQCLAYDVSANAWQFGTIQLSTNAVQFSQLPTPTYYGVGTPFIWANGDILNFTLTYLAA